MKEELNVTAPRSTPEETYLLRRQADNEVFEIPKRIAEDYMKYPQAGFEILGTKPDVYAAQPELAAKLIQQAEERIAADTAAQKEYERKMKLRR